MLLKPPRFCLTAILLILLLFLLPVGAVFAQQEAESRELAVPERIHQAYEAGELSLDESVLYQFYAAIRPDRLPESFRPDSAEIIKCGTPAVMQFQQLRDELDPATVREIESMLSRDRSKLQDTETYESESGRFLIHYETSGSGAVPPEDANENGIPDYVEWVAEAADSSWNHEVGRLGYDDPVLSSSDHYEIEIRDTGNNYGTTYPEGNTTYFTVHNDFEDFPENTDPEGNQKGAMKVTVAHELKHAIQYANSEWYGYPGDPQSPHSDDWSEMDATYMEEVVYDNVNDYYNYIDDSDSIFRSLSHRLPVAYSGVTWFIFFDEWFGTSFWVDVWDRIRERYEQGNSSGNYYSMTEAVELTLQEAYDSNLNTEHTRSHLWHFASGDQLGQSGFGFKEAGLYPSPNIQDTLQADETFSGSSISGLGGRYFLVESEPFLEGQPSVNVRTDSTSGGLALIGYFRNGAVESRIFAPGSTRQLEINSTWDWEELEYLGVSVTNNDPDQTLGFTNLQISSYIPEELALEQNYPNPFNDETTIRFELPENSEVEVHIYDVAGRHVRTALNRELPAGAYEVPFDADGLASGVYIYQIDTGDRRLSKKMTFIK